MAPISPKHLRYRTKRQIAQDVAFVLNAPLTYGTKFAVLADAAWVWTEFHGKYDGCPYWSELAIQLRRAQPKAKLTHEHVVPKKVVINVLFALQSPTPATAFDLLSTFLIGVVITRQEHDLLNVEDGSSMPAAFADPAHADYRDPWLRYKKHDIRVVPQENVPGAT